jgi:hypothetical protein
VQSDGRAEMIFDESFKGEPLKTFSHRWTVMDTDKAITFITPARWRSLETQRRRENLKAYGLNKTFIDLFFAFLSVSAPRVNNVNGREIFLDFICLHHRPSVANLFISFIY